MLKFNTLKVLDTRVNPTDRSNSITYAVIEIEKYSKWLPWRPHEFYKSIIFRSRDYWRYQYDGAVVEDQKRIDELFQAYVAERA